MSDEIENVGPAVLAAWREAGYTDDDIRVIVSTGEPPNSAVERIRDATLGDWHERIRREEIAYKKKAKENYGGKRRRQILNGVIEIMDQADSLCESLPDAMQFASDACKASRIGEWEGITIVGTAFYALRNGIDPNLIHPLSEEGKDLSEFAFTYGLHELSTRNRRNPVFLCQKDGM